MRLLNAVFVTVSSHLGALAASANAVVSEPVATSVAEEPGEVVEQANEVLAQLGGYGYLLLHSLVFILIGMAVVFILHRLASRYLYPRLEHVRLVKVFFGTLYALVLVMTVLVTLADLGFEVGLISRVALVTVLLGAVIVFFLVPFLPRLPFKIGHMVEIKGVLGTVDAISTFHTTIRKFDGTMVFIPNAIVMASQIMNYHDTATRRIAFGLKVRGDGDAAVEFLEQLMSSHPAVLDDPAPSVFVESGGAEGLSMQGYCWVANADFMAARSEIWRELDRAVAARDDFQLALPGQRITLEERPAG